MYVVQCMVFPFKAYAKLDILFSKIISQIK